MVGVINTLVGTAVMFIAYNVFHLSYWISSAANYIIGSICSYFLNKHFTFQNKEKSLKIVVKFIINITICYLIAYGGAKRLILWLLSDLPQNWQDNIAMVCGMGLFVILNYFGQRFFAFKKKEEA
ncbi:MAG: GtrA family protein [Lachnospiraceae bacterium]|nr:GtrA family protein [Lachnospiraceae bacterium]